MAEQLPTAEMQIDKTQVEMDMQMETETNRKKEKKAATQEQVRFVADAFSEVKLYLQTGSDESAYVELGPTNLHKFQLPPNGCQEVETGFDQQDSTAVDEWHTDAVDMGEMVEIDLIRQQDEQKLGQLQRDEQTGEMYMLVPIEIDMLVNHLTWSNESAASPQLQSLEIQANPYEVHEITVPQLTLPLKLDFTADNEEGGAEYGGEEEHLDELESGDD